MFDGFLYGSRSFLVISILINLDIGASFEETGQIIKCFCLRVERDDILHEFGVLVPVRSLEEVSSQNPGLWGSCVVCEGYYLVGIAKLY